MGALGVRERRIWGADVLFFILFNQEFAMSWLAVLLMDAKKFDLGHSI